MTELTTKIDTIYHVYDQRHCLEHVVRGINRITNSGWFATPHCTNSFKLDDSNFVLMRDTGKFALDGKPIYESCILI